MKILIIDDISANRRMLSALLARHGECLGAGSGKEGIAAFQRAWQEGNPFDIACFDIMMPDMDGLTVLERLRKIEDAMGLTPEQKIHALIVSSLDESKYQSRARALGCDAYLVKPIMSKVLFETLKKITPVGPQSPRVPPSS